MYDRIIVPIDGSETADSAAEHGIAQAAAHEAALVFLAVVELSGSAAPEARDEEVVSDQREAYRADVEALAADAQAAGVEGTPVVEVGTPSRVIVREAEARDADLIIMGTRARSGVERLLYGSVTEQVIREGETPVLAVQQ